MGSRHVIWAALMTMGLIIALVLKSVFESDMPIYIYIAFGILLTMIFGSRDWK